MLTCCGGGEQGIEDVQTVELAALLHDIGDWKYTGSDTAGAELAKAFLTEQGHPEDKVEQIIYIIDHVSFSGELARKRVRTIQQSFVHSFQLIQHFQVDSSTLLIVNVVDSSSPFLC